MEINIPDIRAATKSADAKIPSAVQDTLEQISRPKPPPASVLPDAVSRLNSVENVNSGEERTENTTESERPGDRAVLSPESRYYLDEYGEVEIDDAVWQELLNWSPSAGMPIADELSRLADMYRKLLQIILTQTSGKEQAGQLNKLEGVLAEVLNRFINGRLKELSEFFALYGTKDSADALLAAVLRSVTGKNISARELDSLFRTAAGANSPQTRSERYIGSQPHLEQPSGYLYKPSTGGSVVQNQRYSEHIYKEENAELKRQLNQFQTYNGNAPGVRQLRSEGAFLMQHSLRKAYSLQDIQAAQKFIHYFQRDGNLFTHRELMDESYEYYGVYAALTAMKSQIFCARSGAGRVLTSDIRNSLDRLIELYIHKSAAEVTQSAGGGRSSYKNTVEKEIYEIYHRIMEFYRSSANPQKTVVYGLQLAASKELMNGDDKETDEETKERQDSSPFSVKDRKTSAGPRRTKNRNISLEQDWKEFLKTVPGESESQMALKLADMSPWAMTIEPHMIAGKPGIFSPLALAGIAAILVTAAVLIRLAVA